MNIDDLVRDIEDWRVSGVVQYADALDKLVEKFEEIECSEKSIEVARKKCYDEQEKFNETWSKFPKVNIF